MIGLNTGNNYPGMVPQHNISYPQLLTSYKQVYPQRPLSGHCDLVGDFFYLQHFIFIVLYLKNSLRGHDKMNILVLSDRELHDMKTILLAASTKLQPKPVGEQAIILKSINSIAKKVDDLPDTSHMFV